MPLLLTLRHSETETEDRHSLWDIRLLLSHIYSLSYSLSKMQAIKLSKKYPEFKQDEIFDLINKFK